MILSSHYVIKDILHTLKRKDAEEVRKICSKYAGRYRNDKELTAICSMVADEMEEITEKDILDIESRLEELASIRKLDNTGGTGLWYSDRRRLNR